MFTDKLQNREAAKRQVEKVVAKLDCAVCGNKSEAGMMFSPSDPSAFGLEPQNKIIVPLCNPCAKLGFDLPFLEETLLRSGIRRNIDDESSVDDQVKLN
jgi:hypothetical protein